MKQAIWLAVSQVVRIYSFMKEIYKELYIGAQSIVFLFVKTESKNYIKESRVFTDLLSNIPKRSPWFSPRFEGTKNMFYISNIKIIFLLFFFLFSFLYYFVLPRVSCLHGSQSFYSVIILFLCFARLILAFHSFHNSLYQSILPCFLSSFFSLQIALHFYWLLSRLIS